MIISVNWLKKFTPIDIPIDELATLIGSHLVEIEEVIDLGAKYKDVVIARVAECSKLEGSDHLNVTKLDDGGATKDVERDEAGYVQVVCGAPNVREGLLVAWLPPQTVVPETFSDAVPFVLGARKLRGVMSNGMIASAKELNLFDEHDGILEITGDFAPGYSFAKAYELDDYLLDIENKSLTHRPDCFGIIGFAREVAAISGKQFTMPAWLQELSPQLTVQETDVIVPTVTIDNIELSDRYQAVVLSGADGSAMSPLSIQTYLARVGVRPISAVVDVTNYLMMLTGQPLHAFDYDKLIAIGGGANIHVRAGRDKEPLKLLDGRTIELTPEDIVIAAGDTAIGLAGAMGGSETEIDSTTKNIILESATFNLYNLRATQMRHGIFSEAITRFTKGQPAELTAPVLSEAVRLLGEYAHTQVVTPIVEAYPGKRQPQLITLSIETINNVLGSKFAVADAIDTLRNVEFETTLADDSTVVQITSPYWRSDIHIPEDVIEEIGRLNGFDSIEPTLPLRDFTAVRPSEFDELRARIRKILVRAGANEVLTYSFVHGDVLRKAEQDPAKSYRITNSISPDLQYYRQSITPSLLGIIHPNIKNGYDHFAVFEMNKVHTNVAELVEGVPAEMHRLGYVIASKKEQSGASYYYAKGQLEYLGTSLGLELAYKPLGENSLTLGAPFEPRRSARVIDVRSGQPIGVIGEYKKAVARNFKLPVYTAGFELLPEAIDLALKHNSTHSYSPLSRYPSTERDICFQVNEAVTYGQVTDAAKDALVDIALETIITPIDIYQPADGTTKNITLRIRLTAHDRTLTGDEVTSIIANVADQVTAATSAEVV